MTEKEYKENIYQDTFNFEDRITGLITPKQAFGEYVEEEAESNYYKIFFTVLFILVIAILSTITYSDIKEQDDTTSDIVVSIAAISWFVFASFIFLLFAATRFLHICMFIALIVLSSITIKNLEDHNKGMMISILVFSSLGFSILLYYYVLSKTRTDVYKLRKKDKVRKAEEKIQERIRKAEETAIKEEMKKVKNKEGEKEEFKREILNILNQKLDQNRYRKPEKKYKFGEPVNKKYENAEE